MISSRIQLKLDTSLNKQRGLTTLAITLLLLVILTLIVLFSTNVAFFEQRTATSENRERLAQQAAEYGLNLAGEYIKANVSRISSTQTNGWLEPATLKWAKCADADPMPANHPCMSERNTVRREELYYFSADGTDVTNAASELLDLNGATNSTSFTTVLPAGSRITKVGGESVTAGDNGEFAMTPRLQALLCRLDVSDPANPRCAADPDPTGGNQIVITLISQATLGGENAVATVKESWASVNTFNGAAAVPLVASGLVQGLGNATIVAAPDGGGPGVTISIWSPRDVDIDSSGAGIGSVITCHRDNYHLPWEDVKTACAANNTCNCTPLTSLVERDRLSGHSAAIKREGKDILDVDGNHAGDDLQLFPGVNGAGVQMDDPAVANDDSLFEWIFGASDATVEGATITALTCPSLVNPTANVTNDCAITYLIDTLGAQVINSCASLSASSSGLYYVNAATCSLPNQVGSANSNAIVVTRAPSVSVNGTLLYGMLFVHSATNTAQFDGTGTTKVFGSVVVEGNVDMHGNIDLIYMNTSANTPGDPLPAGTRFAKVVGSWLDERRGF